MPFVRISHPSGKPAKYRTALSESVHQAMIETFDVPVDDRFQILTEHAAATEIVHPASYLGVSYSDDLVMIQITCSFGRSVETKKKLYTAIADRISQSVGLRREDIIINLVETGRENWSFGNGLAAYV